MLVEAIACTLISAWKKIIFFKANFSLRNEKLETFFLYPLIFSLQDAKGIDPISSERIESDLSPGEEKKRVYGER